MSEILRAAGSDAGIRLQYEVLFVDFYNKHLWFIRVCVLFAGDRIKILFFLKITDFRYLSELHTTPEILRKKRVGSPHRMQFVRNGTYKPMELFSRV